MHECTHSFRLLALFECYVIGHPVGVLSDDIELFQPSKLPAHAQLVHPRFPDKLGLRQNPFVLLQQLYKPFSIWLHLDDCHRLLYAIFFLKAYASIDCDCGKRRYYYADKGINKENRRVAGYSAEKIVLWLRPRRRIIGRRRRGAFCSKSINLVSEYDC